MENHAPCFNCEDRTSDCHSKCQKYIIWQEEHISLNKKLRDERCINNALNRLQFTRRQK